MTFDPVYLLIVPVLLLAASKVLLQSNISRNHFHSTTDIVLYNSIMFLITAIILLIFNSGSGFSTVTLLCGIAYGIISAVFQVVYTAALGAGPVSLTVMIGSFGSLFPILYGLLFCNETIQIQNWLGIILVVLSLLLTSELGSVHKKDLNLKWFILALVNMFCEGALVITAKIQKQFVTGEDRSMILLAYAIASLLLFAYFLLVPGMKAKKTVKLTPKLLGVIGIIAVIMAAYSPLMMLCMGQLPVSIFSPLMNIGCAIVITILSFILFREKLTRNQKISLILGIPAIFLLTVSF